MRPAPGPRAADFCGTPTGRSAEWCVRDSPTDVPVLPGTPHRPADVIRVLVRRRWWIVVPLTLGTIGFSSNVVAGFGGGLAVGLLLVGFLEYRDSSFSSEEEVARVLTLPVLGSIPPVRSERDRQRRRYQRLAGDIAVVVLLLSAVLRALWRLRSA